MYTKEQALDFLFPSEIPVLNVVQNEPQELVTINEEKKRRHRKSVQRFKAKVAVQVWENRINKLPKNDVKVVAYEAALSRAKSISRKDDLHKRQEAKIRRRAEFTSDRRDRYNYDPE